MAASYGNLTLMALQSPTSEAGTAGLNAILSHPHDALLAFDFDGVLSPIVADPAQSRSYPGVVDALLRLSTLVGSLGIVTGREVGSARCYVTGTACGVSEGVPMKGQPSRQ